MHPFFSFVHACVCITCALQCAVSYGDPKTLLMNTKYQMDVLHRFSPRGFGSRLGVNHSKRPSPWFVPLRHATVRNATNRCVQKWSFFLLFYSRHGNYQRNLLSVKTSHSWCKLHEVIRTVTYMGLLKKMLNFLKESKPRTRTGA